MSALQELLKEIPSDYDEVDVANHLLHFREQAAAELASLTQQKEKAEAERDAAKLAIYKMRECVASNAGIRNEYQDFEQVFEEAQKILKDIPHEGDL